MANSKAQFNRATREALASYGYTIKTSHLYELLARYYGFKTHAGFLHAVISNQPMVFTGHSENMADFLTTSLELPKESHNVFLAVLTLCLKGDPAETLLSYVALYNPEK